MFFGLIGKTRWPPWPLIGWGIFNFSWNRWTELKETWQEARSRRPLPSLCFSGRSEKQDCHPGLLLAETFSTSPLKPLNGIQPKLIGSKISTSSTMFVFFGRLVYKNGRPDQSIKKVAHCTQVHVMWPFEPLVKSSIPSSSSDTLFFLLVLLMLRFIVSQNGLDVSDWFAGLLGKDFECVYSPLGGGCLRQE